MSLRFILGHPGTGKTTICINEILALGNDVDHNKIFIVPEQFTLQTEMELVEKSGVNAFMYIQVLSFQRLSYYVFSKTGGHNKIILEDIGKSILLRKILNNLGDRLKFFTSAVDKQGFMEKLCDTVSEFYRYNISPDLLRQTAGNISGNETLKLKLEDLCMIIEKYIEFQEQNYISDDEILDVLAERLDSPGFLSDAHIWIDGFNGFTPQEYRVIEKLLNICERVSITLPVDTETLNDSSGTFYYSQIKKTYARLIKMAAENNVYIEKHVELRDIYRQKNELEHLENNFLSETPKVFNEDVHNIRIFPANNMYSEITQTAAEIIELVREKKLLYNEIGILSCSLEEYNKILKSVFNKYDLPLFIDTKTDIMSHPLIELVMSALDIIIENWSYESVFRLLKTSLTPLGMADIDIVENYVLANGIKGYKWRKAWEYGFDVSYEAFDRDFVNAVREKIVDMMRPLTDSLKTHKKYTVEYISEHLFLFLQEINITEAIGWLGGGLIIAEDMRMPKEHSQIWDKFIMILDKMVEILGKDSVSLEEYRNILEAGLSKADLGVIPLSLDQIIAGDLKRSRLHNIKALFIIGATEANLPSKSSDSGLLNDDERSFLGERHGIELMPDSLARSYEEYFLILNAFCRPSDYLYISYYLGGLDGKSFLPSPVIKKIKNIFPKIEEYRIETIISSPEFAYNALLTRIWEFMERGCMPDVYTDIYSLLIDDKFYGDRLKNILKNLKSENTKLKLTCVSADKVYGGKFKTSVSRLERFIRCPFSYFSQFNLKAQKRRIYEIESIDLGNLLHDALDNFSERISSINWREEESDVLRNLASESIDFAIDKETKGIFRNSPQYVFFAERVKRIANKSVTAVLEHMKSGEFDFNFSEVVFSVNSDFPAIEIQLTDNVKMLLEGRIDRADTIVLDNKEYVKIIDYKFGGKAFSFPEVFYGLQLQLIVYLDAFMRKYKNEGKQIIPAAILYFRLDNPVLDFEKISAGDTVESAILKKFKMSGVVLDDPKVMKSLDQGFEKSDIIPVAIKSGGNLTERSSALSEEAFRALIDFVLDKTAETGKDILAGNISRTPQKYKNESACRYCDYKAICRFDAVQNANSFRILKPIKSKDAINIIKSQKSAETEIQVQANEKK